MLNAKKMLANTYESVRSVRGKKVLLRWLLRGLILAAVLWLVFVLAGQALRRIALVQIAELTNTKVKAESVDFNLDCSVSIEKLVVRPHQKRSADDAILKANTVYTRFGIGSLLLLRPRLKEINISDFVFDARYYLDTGRWNVSELKINAPNGKYGKIPAVRLEKGKLQYSSISNGTVKVVAAIPLDAIFEPAEKNQDGYSFKITTAEKTGSGKSMLVGSWKPGRIIIAGGISSADIPAFERAWQIKVLAAQLTYEQNSTYSLNLKIKDLLSTHKPAEEPPALGKPTFLETWTPFTALQGFFNRYHPWGQVDIDLYASGNVQQLTESRLRGTVYCKDVSIIDRKFPYLVQQISGEVDFTQSTSKVKNMTGRHGDVNLVFNGWSEDFGPDCRYQIQITSDNMALDNDLYTALNTKQKKLWSAFAPTGVAAINYCLSRQSQTDEKNALAVELLDAEATYQNFPYPLKKLTGKLFFDRESMVLSDVISQSNRRKIALNGEITALNTEQPIYNISVKAENIPLDSKLVAALPKTRKHLYQRFDTGGLISIENLSGRFWGEEKSKEPCYNLSLHTKEAQLNDKLFSLLSAPLKEMVSELQPEGKVNISVDLNKVGEDNYPDYMVTVDCLDDSFNPKTFPYPLKDITGGLTITADSIKLQNITATTADSGHETANASTIKLNGEIALDDNAFSSGRFHLSADNIIFREQLTAALPEGIRLYYSKLSPTGRFDLDLKNIRVFNADDGKKYIDFAGATTLKNCNFNTSGAITELYADLEMKGLYKTGEGLHSGQTELIDGSLRVNGKALKGLKANFHYDHQRRSWLTKNLIGDCYGGRLTGKFKLKKPYQADWQYLLQAGFENIDLKRFLSDTKRKETSENGGTSGRMGGSLSISSAIGDSLSRIGRCKLTIRDMQAGRLSPLSKLLYVLKLTEPKDFAFERMFVDSYIKQNSLFFEKLDLSGKALAFNGTGWMNLQNQNVNLILAARGPRLATAEPSILQSLTEGLGQAVVRMEVTGNFYNPQVKTTTLPVIKDSLEILGTRPSEPD